MAPSAIVVGAGVMGLAAGWALARENWRVTVVDQASIPNPMASSWDDHRLIRAAYGSRTGYMRLARDAYAAWTVLERETGDRLCIPTGTLALAGPRDDWARQSAAALATAGIEVRTLRPAELATKFPLLDCQSVDTAFAIKDGGVLLARPILQALIRRVSALGGHLRAGCRVVSVDAARGRVALADGERLEADLVIVAAGPWAPRLFPDLASRVTPSRQPVLYLQPPAPAAALWAAMPMVLEIDPQAGFYLVPPVAGTRIKVGIHRVTNPGDPEDSREASDAEIAPILDACRKRLRDFGGYAAAACTACYYTVERQERFVIEPIGPQGWVMTGFSGHGFKFAALLGLELAEVAAGKRAAAAFTRRAAGDA